MRPDLFLATIGRGSNGSNALEVTEDRAAVTAESQDNIINRVNNVSQYGPSWHYVPGIGVAGTAYAEVPGSALGDLTFSRASSKTRTNSAGVVETIASNVPPHDYRNADGTLSTFPRLNLEPQRTNSIRNSSMVGAVAGSPGTLPTNWSISNLGTLTRTVVGTGTENGLPYIDYRIQGTASNTTIQFAPEPTTQIAATNGQAWASSYYLKSVAGTIPDQVLRISQLNSGGTNLATNTQSIVVDGTLKRYSYAFTMNQATTAFVFTCVQLTTTVGAAYDFTIRIAAPQMELGGFATTWLPTTTAAVTRLADTASKTGVSSLIGQTEGTLFAEVNMRNLVSGARILIINNGTTDNRAMLFYTSGSLTFNVNSGGVTVVTIAFPTTTQGSYKLAASYKQNDFVLYVNGAQVGTDTSGATPSSLSRIDAGNELGFNILSDTIAQAALFPTRLTNAQLAQLTTL